MLKGKIRVSHLTVAGSNLDATADFSKRVPRFSVVKHRFINSISRGTLLKTCSTNGDIYLCSVSLFKENLQVISLNQNKIIFLKKVVITNNSSTPLVSRKCLEEKVCPESKGLYCCYTDGCNNSSYIYTNKSLIFTMIFVICIFFK